MITVDLGKKLQSAKLGDEDDACAHFTQLMDLQEQLASMGKTLDDNEFASILLGLLPPSYSPTIGGINAVANCTGNVITSDQVIQLILDEYNRCTIHKNKNGPDEAFSMTTQKKQCDKRNMECYNYHKLGHYKSDCWAKGGDKEGQSHPEESKIKAKSTVVTARVTGAMKMITKQIWPTLKHGWLLTKLKTSLMDCRPSVLVQPLPPSPKLKLNSMTQELQDTCPLSATGSKTTTPSPLVPLLLLTIVLSML